jgi:hypothetical protein
MKPAITCLLILALVIPAEAREPTPLEQARRIAFGSRVKVELRTRRIVQGRLGEMMDTSFTLDPVKVGNGPGIEMLFQDVSKIRSIEPKKKATLLRPMLVPLALPIILICGPAWIFHKQCGI